MKPRNASLSRRKLFKKGAAAAASAALLSQSSTAFGQAPAVVTARSFRAWISRGTGRGRTTLHDVRLRPISGRQVVVRTESCNLCYSNVGAVLGIQAAPPATGPATPATAGLTALNTNDMALIQGHGGVGIVEAIGPEVRRVQIGDRVCVSGTPQCGACYHCLRGRADVCQLLGRNLAGDLVPVADLRDGTPVYSNSHIGGLAELMITTEEWVVPVVTTASAVDLGMVLSCVSVAGLGATTTGTLAVVAPGSVVAVVGCGPLGLSAVQGARIAGASTIIAIDPIRVRRELALKIGATHALDPNVEGDAIIERYAVSQMDRPVVHGAAGATRADDEVAPALISSSKRRARSSFGPSSKPVQIRPAFCPCSRRIKCAMPAATWSRPDWCAAPSRCPHFSLP